jgi:hypothetical protein
MWIALALFFSQPVWAEIIRPDPREFSQISDFHPDWCSDKVESASVAVLCYGKSLFRKSLQIRSFLVKNSRGEARLYLEDQWPSVDLLKPAFGLVGPVHVAPNSKPESGHAVLTFDRQGEVREVWLETPSLGNVRAVR